MKNLTDDILFDILKEIAECGTRFCRIAWKTEQKAGGEKFTLCTVQANVDPSTRTDWTPTGKGTYYHFTHGNVLAMHNTNGTRYVQLCKSTMRNQSTYAVGLQDAPRPHGTYDGFNKKLSDILAVKYNGETYVRKGEVIPFVLD